jgi:hypothetical protein
VARTRTTKKLAQRIDLNYFKRPTPLKRAKLLLSVLLPLLALVWIAWRGLSGDHRVYSSGRMSQAHAVLEKECSACHVQTASAFSAKAADSACLDCHDGPAHHDSKTAAPNCATCHVEHRGRVNIKAASNEACAECHESLQLAAGTLHYAAKIRSFEDGHPEFGALRPVADVPARDPATIKLNHALHMKLIRQGPNGPTVQLECADCHRNYGATWRFALTQYPAMADYQLHRDMPIDNLPFPLPTFHPLASSNHRERMLPVQFAYACSGCHLLSFDKRFDEGVPHDKPEIVHAFVVNKFTAYIAAHPGELRETQDPERDLTGKPLPPRARALTVSQWVAEKTAVAEELLWHKTCAQCHRMSGSPLQDTRIARWSPANANPAGRTPAASQAESLADQQERVATPKMNLPTVAPANTTLKWMPHAKFDHGRHEGFTCVSCHAKALTSTEASDVLLPGIETCKKCHAPGPEHAESRCFECHTYHDWSKRKEVTPKFTLPALRTGGR